MKTSKADFLLFQEECKYWLDYFGLQGWRVFYVAKKLDKAYAECYANVEDRTSSLFLNTEFLNEIVTKEEIKRSAFHEVCELWFARIEVMAKSRFVIETVIREEVHNLIRTLENTIYKEKRG